MTMTGTKIKLCGLSRPRDIRAANALKPEFVGFVFAPRSRRYVSPQQAKALKALLSPEIRAVGVFVDEEAERVAELLDSGVIDLAQLHGAEDNGYVRRLPSVSGRRRTSGGRRTAAPTTFCWTPAPERARSSTGGCSGRSGGPISWPAGWACTMWKRRWRSCTRTGWT